jgi:hypothetical protein
MSKTLFINTSLQRGDRTGEECKKRFNGFSRAAETVETVSIHLLFSNTPLKQGVNESGRFNNSTI